MVVDERDAAIEWGTRALQLAERLGDTEAQVYALTNMGMAQADAGIDGGKDMLMRALALARSSGLDEHAGRAFNGLVMWPIRLRQFNEIGSYLEDGLEFCEQRGLDTWRLYLLACRASLELARGDWDAAADSAELVLRNPRSARVARVWALTTRGLIRARRGDPDASEPLAEAHEHAGPTGELMQISPETAARAELAWLGGANATVKRVTEPALALAIEREIAWVVGELAYWRWQAGVDEQLPTALLAEPYRLSMAGDWAGAAQLWREIGCPYEAALALGDADEEPALRQALEELRDLGARPAAAIVARRLRALGARGVPRGPRPSTQENPAGPHHARARGARAGGRGTAQRGDRRAADRHPQDRRPPRLRDPAQARRPHPRPGRRGRHPPRAFSSKPTSSCGCVVVSHPGSPDLLSSGDPRRKLSA